ncbi:unnamed protein product, partial [Mesorhabditis spiculigera]
MATFKPRSVLITGAARGIGLGLVRQFIKRPYLQHIFAGVRDPAKAEDLKKIGDSRLHIIQLDILSDSDIQSAVKTIANTVGSSGLELLVNNAAVLIPYQFSEPPNRANVDSVMRTNVTSQIIVTHYMLPLLEQSTVQSAIVNMGSDFGSLTQCSVYGSSEKGYLPHKCSKAALSQFSRVLAEDLSEKGILVINIYPGWVATDMGTDEAPVAVEESVSSVASTIDRIDRSFHEHDGPFGADFYGKLIPANGFATSHTSHPHLSNRHSTSSMKMSGFDLGGLFAPPPPQPLMGVQGVSAPPTPLWPPLGQGAGHPQPLLNQLQAYGAQGGIPPLMELMGNGAGGAFHQLSQLGPLHGGPAPPPTPFSNSAPLPTLDLAPKPPDSIKGFGQLTWLSSKAGLITCKDKMVISFQIKDFCDQQLTDLTSVLRVGFTLSFQAALSESSEYIATLVSPLYGPEAETVFANSHEVNLEKLSPNPQNSKDAYSCAEEARAIPALLGIFQRHSLPQIQLSSMHSHISSCGDEELFRYVGSSSLKRRQFVERRTHLFKLNSDDTIALQAPWIYSCVFRLASRLLRRGGATAIQSLYEFYCSPEMPTEVRETIGEGRGEFLGLIQAHPWIFALFPNRTYVSVRRNLPQFDYGIFIKQTFPENDLFRPPSALNHYGHQQNPGRVMRSLSHQPVSSGRAPVAPSRPHALWESQNPIGTPTLNSAPQDQWSMFNQGNAWRPTPTGSTQTLLGQTPTTQRVLVSASTQTQLGLGQAKCMCHCTCGASQSAIGQPQPFFQTFRANGYAHPGGSASPPSVESGSPESRGPSSPVPPSNMRYYDPFGPGFDIAAMSNLSL